MSALIDGGNSPDKLHRKSWRVGTLTYSFGGLALLFGWLLWGDFAWSVRDRVIPVVMQLLFKKFGASDLVAGCSSPRCLPRSD